MPRDVCVEHAIPEISAFRTTLLTSKTVIGSSLVMRRPFRMLPCLEVLDVLLIAQHVPEGLLLAALAPEWQPPDRPGIVGELLQWKYDPVGAHRAGEAELEPGIDHGPRGVGVLDVAHVLDYQPLATEARQRA